MKSLATESWHQVTNCHPFYCVPALAFNSKQRTGVGRWASSGAGVRGRLDDVRPSLTVKASDHCVCPESQGVPSWCCKTCIQMSVPGTASAIGLTVPGTSIKLQASLQSYPFAPREDFQVEKNSESEEVWVEVAFRSGKIAFSFFLKKPHEPSRPKPEITSSFVL